MRVWFVRCILKCLLIKDIPPPCFEYMHTKINFCVTSFDVKCSLLFCALVELSGNVLNAQMDGAKQVRKTGHVWWWTGTSCSFSREEHCNNISQHLCTTQTMSLAAIIFIKSHVLHCDHYGSGERAASSRPELPSASSMLSSAAPTRLPVNKAKPGGTQRYLLENLPPPGQFCFPSFWSPCSQISLNLRAGCRDTAAH